MEKNNLSAPKVSFIVPIFKVEKYLQSCVESILDQSYRDFEVILVDDGSPDNCGTICDAYAYKDPRIRVIHQANGGLSNARNSGIDIARGKYLWFVDSDDYIRKDCLGMVVAQMEEQELEMLILSYALEFEEHGTVNIVKNKGTSNIITGYDYIKSDYYEAFVWQKVTLASVYRENGIRFNEAFQYEDIQIMPFLLKKIKRLAFSNYEEGFYFYRIRPDSITTTRNKEKQRRQIEMCYEIEESWRVAFDFHTHDKESFDYLVKTRVLDLLHYLMISLVIRADFSISEKNEYYRDFLKKGMILKDMKSTIKLIQNEPTKQLVFYRALNLSPRLLNVYSWLHEVFPGKSSYQKGELGK